LTRIRRFQMKKLSCSGYWCFVSIPGWFITIATLSVMICLKMLIMLCKWQLNSTHYAKALKFDTYKGQRWVFKYLWAVGSVFGCLLGCFFVRSAQNLKILADSVRNLVTDIKSLGQRAKRQKILIFYTLCYHVLKSYTFSFKLV